MTVLTDVRYATRALVRRPGFAGAAVAALALGLGAAAAMFAVVDAVLLKPLPYADPDRLVVLRQLRVDDDDDVGLVSPATYLDWRDDGRALSATAVVRPWTYTFEASGSSEDLDTGLVSEGFFDLIGVQPDIGRPFAPEDYAPGAPGVVMLTHGVWQRLFGADPDVVGRAVQFEDETLTIAGVLPESFWWFDRAQVAFAPFRLTEQHRQLRAQTYLTVVGRLAGGESLASARAETSVIAERLAGAYPEAYADATLTVRSVVDDVTGDVRPALVLLLGAVALVCLITGANVAGLMIVRSVERARELDVRSALGAGPSRLVRQMFVESVLLATSGAALGLVLAHWLLGLMIGLTPADVPRLGEAAIDGRVVAVGAALAIAMACAATLVPAWRVRRADGLQALRASATVGHARSALVRRWLVTAEMALTFVLLVGALLLGRSFVRLLDVDPGFDARGVAMVELHVWSLGAPDAQAAFFRDALASVRAVPGIQAVGAVSAPPFLGSASIEMEADVAPEDSGAAVRRAWLTIASDGYVETLGMRVAEGRAFTEGDRAGGPQVAMISDSLARRLFDGSPAVGRRMVIDNERTPEPVEVVGVVGSLRHVGLDAGARDEVFVPLDQTPFGSMNVVVRTSAEPASAVPAVLAAIQPVSPAVRPSGVTVLEDLVGRTVAPRRFYFTLAAWLAGLALALAAVGLYGLVSVQMAQRTREIGLRVALGGQPRHVLSLVVATAFWPPVVGVAIGAAAAGSLSGWLRSSLYGIEPTDPMTYAMVAAVLLAAAVIAALVPARRALAVDPVVALKD